MKVREVLENLNGEHTVNSLSKEVQISEKKLSETLKTLGSTFDNSTKIWSFEGDENILDTDIHNYVPKRTVRNSVTKVSTPKNDTFTKEEVDVLKELIQEHKRGYELFSEYRIYDELSKVPTDRDTVRNAYNISTGTTERLKQFALKRRLPLQDLVELAILNLLEKYDK